MTDKRELQLTADGSHTLYIAEIDEHYHSINGAMQESRHVFINAGLKQLDKEKIRILEIGFGTGLNAFLTLLEAECEVEYFAVERYPLDADIIRSLNYGKLICKEKEGLFFDLHSAPWEISGPITANFTLHKTKGDSNVCAFPDKVDLVYFDAFAPDKQPEMWNQEIFDKLYRQMQQGGILVTYCAKGAVRRMMQKAGYSVERIPGPPGKREMLRAIK